MRSQAAARPLGAIVQQQHWQPSNYPVSVNYGVSAARQGWPASAIAAAGSNIKRKNFGVERALVG